MMEFVKFENFSSQTIKKFLIKNFLVLGLLLALAVGLAFPRPGEFLNSLEAADFSIIKTINVCTIFFISGLTLRTSEIKSALSAYLAFAYGILSILVVTPLAGYLALEIPYSQNEFSIGFAVFCVVPTTLTSGATLVMQANGNYALALMITVCTNVLGVVTVPFALKIILEGVANGVSINAVKLLTKLVLTILLPLIFGKIIRHLNPKILRFGKKHKIELSMVNNGSLVMVVWQTISSSQQSIIDTKFTSILLLIFSGICLHFLYLLINYFAVLAGRWETPEKRAILIVASQKTLPVAITIISYFGSSVGDQGLITLPCIIGHLSQLFIDSYLVTKMVANDPPQNSNSKQNISRQNFDENNDEDFDENSESDLNLQLNELQIIKVESQRVLTQRQGSTEDCVLTTVTKNDSVRKFSFEAGEDKREEMDVSLKVDSLRSIAIHDDDLSSKNDDDDDDICEIQISKD